MAATVRCIVFAAALALAAAPGSAKAQSSADRRCLWASLPTVDQARIELAVRLGEPTPISVIDRMGTGGLSEHLTGCGFPETNASLSLLWAYWTATASFEVARARLRLADVPPEAVDGRLDARTPDGADAALGEEIMRRIRGRSRALLLDMLNEVDAVRETAGAPLSVAQKRLLVEYASARLILRGLDAGADPSAGDAP